MNSKWFSGRWLRNGLLVASLCLNAILVGYVATVWMKRERPFEALVGTRIIERVASRLPSTDADILWQAYRSRQSEFSSARADYVQALVKPIRLLREEHLDIDALRKAMSDSRDKRQKVGDLVTETFVDAVAKMSVEGRRKLVGGLALR